MVRFNFDLEDGLPRVSFTLNEADSDRMLKFMAGCNRAVVAEAQLRKALLDACEQLDGWINWKCPRKHRSEHQSHVAHLRAIAADPEPVEVTFDLLAHLVRQRNFSARTFGPGTRTKGVCDHIRKELFEIETSPDDLTEWIDVVILAFDGAWRTGATPMQVVEALVAKQEVNERRRWPDWQGVDPDKAIEHCRSAESSGEL